jgi:hypothetical protein
MEKNRHPAAEKPATGLDIVPVKRVENAAALSLAMNARLLANVLPPGPSMQIARQSPAPASDQSEPLSHDRSAISIAKRLFLA